MLGVTKDCIVAGLYDTDVLSVAVNYYSISLRNCAGSAKITLSLMF